MEETWDQVCKKISAETSKIETLLGKGLVQGPLHVVAPGFSILGPLWASSANARANAAKRSKEFPVYKLPYNRPTLTLKHFRSWMF